MAAGLSPFKDFWVVYRREQSGLPRFTATRWIVTRDGLRHLKVLGADTLEGLRQKLPEGLSFIPRADDDPPQIVEQWMK